MNQDYLNIQKEQLNIQKEQAELKVKQNIVDSFLDRALVRVYRLEKFEKVSEYSHKYLIKNYGKMPAANIKLKISAFKKDRYTGSETTLFSSNLPPLADLVSNQEIYAKIVNEYQKFKLDFTRYDLIEKGIICYTLKNSKDYIEYNLNIARMGSKSITEL